MNQREPDRPPRGVTREEIRRLLPLQAGALLGPMAGTGMVTLIPALAGVYGVSVGQVGLAITAYMLPFAATQFFSGAISQLLTGRRTATLGYGVFILASLGCAAAPTLPTFLAFRLVQGVGAAFLFPILMALVGEAVAPERLGRAIGAFGVTQTLGLTLGPLLAGLFQVHLGWQWFFVALALFAAVAAAGFVGLFGAEPEPASEEGSVWAIAGSVLREPAVVMLSLAAAGLFFAMIGTYTYLAAWLKDAHGLAEDRIGLVLGVAGAVGIPASAMAGRWVDRLGRKAVGLGGLAAYVVALVGFTALPYSFGGIVALAALLGWAGAVTWTSLNTLAVEVMPTLRKPVASIYNAFRFFGYSLAPPLLGGVYARHDVTGVYVVCAIVTAASATLLAALGHPQAGQRP